MLLLISGLFFYSCAGIEISENTIEMSELQLHSDYEMFDMRLVFSEAPTEIGYTKNDTSASENPGHPLCMNLGNSIYVDLYGNVFISVLDFYNLIDKDDWEIEYNTDSIQGHCIAKREGNIIYFENNKELIKVTDKATIDVAGVRRKTGRYNREITIFGDEYKYESDIPLNDRDLSLKKLNDNELLADKTTVTKIDNEIIFKDHIYHKNNFPSRIVNNSGIIEIYRTIDFLIFFKKEVLATKIARTEEGFIVLNRNSFGAYDKDIISIDKNRMECQRGMIKTYFEIQ